jgi:hypothetical protein
MGGWILTHSLAPSASAYSIKISFAKSKAMVNSANTSHIA